MLKILHLTDLHYSKKIGSDPNLLNKIIRAISKNIKNNSIDLLIFSGDLVFSGEKLEDFHEAKDNFIYPLCEKLNINKSNVFFCCGNHDIHRNQELEIITDTISKFKTEEELSKFINVEQQFNLSVENIKNYNQFIKEYYTENYINNFQYNDLYTITKVSINGNKFDIVSINSSWRCKDDQDEGNLLFPSKLLNELISKLDDESFKIATIHHPLSDLKYFNRVLVEKLLTNNFQLLLSGHTHSNKKNAIANNEDGLVSVSSEASLSKISKYESTGFSIIEVNSDLFEVYIESYRYDIEYIPYLKDSVKLSVPTGEDKRVKIDFKKNIIKLFDSERENLRMAFVEQSGEKDFFELFQVPIIKNQPSNSIKQISNQKVLSKEVSIDALFQKSNFIIYGRDKYGKTLVLYYLYLKLLQEFNIYKTIPILIDKHTKFKDIEQIISDKLQVNRNTAIEYIKEYNLKLIVDDYFNLKMGQKSVIEDFIANNSNCTFVFSCNESILSDIKEVQIDGAVHENLFLHDLNTKQIRNIAKTNLNCKDEIVESILNKINLVFKQLNLPKNYWTISLFIHIFNVYGEKKFNNNFELIELYIDSLLGREKIVQDRSIKIEYESLKDFLGNLAIFLIRNHHQDSYRITFAELIAFMKDYAEKHRRFNIDPKNLFDKLMEIELFKESPENVYTFRLKGVFEYFVAYNLKDNQELREEVINKDNVYLSFGNELELVAGFNKKDKAFLKQIFEKTKGFFDPINSYYENIGNSDFILNDRSKKISLKLDNVKKGINSLVQKDADNLKDFLNPISEFNSEVSSKQVYEKIEINSENLEKLLFILSRTFRNSGVEDHDLTNEILDFILTSSCNLCFFIADNEDNLRDYKNNDFLKIFSSLIPLVIETYLFEALSQNNLEKIFLEKIEELKKKKGSELKIFVLYYMLIDLDLKNNKMYISEAISSIKNNIIKHSSLYKLLSYLIFSKYNSEQTRLFIAESAISQAKMINKDEKYISNLRKTLDQLKVKNRLR